MPQVGATGIEEEKEKEEGYQIYERGVSQNRPLLFPSTPFQNIHSHLFSNLTPHIEQVGTAVTL
jgi:hypothetical protein